MTRKKIIIMNNKIEGINKCKNLSNINIGTINIRGFNSLEKILYTYEIVKRLSIDILVIQETHINDELNLKLIEENFNNYKIFFPLTKKKTKGVGIILSENLNLNNIRIENPDNERIIIISFNINNCELSIVNIYSPNDYKEQISFVNLLYEKLFFRKNVILVGDFNFVENNFSDRTSNAIFKEKNRIHEEAWRQFLQIMKFKEPPFNDNYNTNSRTWKNGEIKARLDRFYIRNDNQNINVSYSALYDFIKSDHQLVLSNCTFKGTNLKKFKNPSIWRLNDSVLDNKDIEENIVSICNEIRNYFNENDSSWYDIFINKITTYLKKASRTLHLENKKHLDSLFEEHYILSNKVFLNNELIDRKKSIDEQINKYYKNMRIGIETRKKFLINKFDKTPTKILLSNSNSDFKKSNINHINVGDSKITDSSEIRKKFYEHYFNLMGISHSAGENFDSYEFKIPKIENIDCIDRLNTEYTYEESYKIIEKMKSSSPGANGLSINFYKKFFPFFGKYYVNMINKAFSLPNQFNLSIIKLINKNNKTEKSIGDYRPISITNYDYRIFTKILSNRLKNLNTHIFKNNQFCSIEGKKIDDIIHLVKDFISDSNLRIKPLNITLIDQAKAFDSISHDYLAATLKHINIGDRLLNSILKLYENSNTKICVNGILSNQINIKRGIKQGCPLSMWLYTICIEDLLIKINLNKNIIGYRFNIINNYEIKNKAYADDVTCFTVDTNSIIEIFNEFTRWGKFSGSNINKEKTQIISINSSIPESLSKFIANEAKILGIIFDKFGPAKTNLKTTITKLYNALTLWNNCSLNMIQRITALKTFICSKLWFVLKFCKLNEETIKSLENDFFHFVWNGKRDFINRNQMKKSIENGGLNMLCLNSTLIAMDIKYFQDFTKNFMRDEFQYGLKFLKFHIKHLLDNYNFNIIPVENKIPFFYKTMLTSVNNFIETEKNLIERNKLIMSQKDFYILIKRRNEDISKVEINARKVYNWKEIYKSLHLKELSSALRTLNFKILHNGLATADKFQKDNSKCFLCKKKKESIYHIFAECDIVRTAVNENGNIKLTEDQEKNFDIFTKNISLNRKQILYISNFKYIIWNTRNISKYEGKIENIKKCLKKRFENYTDNDHG